MQNIIDQVLDLLKTSLSNKVKTFYQGNPMNLTTSMLPVVFVEANGSDTSVNATGLDAVVHTITIGLIYDKRSELGGVLNENVANRTMIKIMEDRNANGQYADDSITGIVRKNFTLNNSINNQLLSLKYSVSNRGTAQAPIIYDEARITFRVTEFVPVPSRV